MSVLRWSAAFLAFSLLLVLHPAESRSAGSKAIGAVIKEIFSSESADTGFDNIDTNYESVRTFYASRFFKPVWTRDTGPKSKGKALLEELKRSSVHGLSPAFYDVDEIEPLMGVLEPTSLAKLDLLLSAALIEYADDLSNGRIGPDDRPSHNLVQPHAHRADELIEGAAAAGNLREFASNLLTTDSRYFRLIAKLAEFDRIEKSGYWPKIPADGPDIQAGADDPRMVAIRRLLVFIGDLPASEMENGSVHDTETVRAVHSYQKSHGIESSGIIDRNTLLEMAVSIPDRITKILLNLERRRWQNRDIGDNHIYINLADQTAKLVLNGKTAAFFPLVATTELRDLPTFYGRITAIKTGSDETPDISLAVESSFPDNVLSTDTALALNVTDPKHLPGIIKNFSFKELLTDAEIANSLQSRTLELKEPLNLFVSYLTAWANKDGSVDFRPDIFERDEELIELLELE